MPLGRVDNVNFSVAGKGRQKILDAWRPGFYNCICWRRRLRRFSVFRFSRKDIILDVEQQIAQLGNPPEAFRFILSSGRVKAVLINIFGGITRCDDIAKGILTAFEQIDITVPVVVRLAGTNAEEGRAMLEGSNLVPAETLADAVKKTIALGNSAA